MGSGNHGHAHANQQGNQAASKADTDVDADHDPERARKVSNAGLNKEANKAGAANADALHDDADQAAYESLFASIDMLASRMHSAADDIWGIISAPEDEGGIYKKIDMVQTIYNRMTDQLVGLRMTMMRVKIASYRPLGKDLGALQNGVERFMVAADAARSKFASTPDVKVEINYDMPRNELDLMYQHVGLPMPKTVTIDAKDDPSKDDPTKLLKTALVSAETSMRASVKAIRARLTAPDAELKEEVGKLIGGMEEMRENLESLPPDVRIGSTKGLATVIHEVDGIVAELDKKPAMKAYLESAAAYNTLSVLRGHLHR